MLLKYVRGGFYCIFLLPGLEKKFVSDFAVGKKIMRERGFFIACQIKK